MKRVMKYLGALALLGGLGLAVEAAQICNRADMYCYESGATGNLSTIGRLDSSGNLSTLGNATLGSVAGASVGGTGNLTYGGVTVMTPTTVVLASSCSVITPTSTFIDLETPLAITMGACLGTVFQGPIISTAGATAGQYLVLGTTSTVSTVTLSTTAAASGMVGSNIGNAAFVLSSNHTLSFIFDGIAQVWRMINY